MSESTSAVLIDCDQCVVRPSACSDCVVSVLLGAPPRVEWDETERRAIDALTDGGMLPRLRLVESPDAESGPDTMAVAGAVAERDTGYAAGLRQQAG
ncbi:hypothetical protein [Haloechinothrix halophila]|uniref:hypothetical protein n=1 Tax=Haloechinothrix halophila TaxID=1069073 RepID=UPI00041B6437|nr:hypothetical protein [Haloechinothrix halophila]